MGRPVSGVRIHRPTDRPDVVDMACEAGEYDREAFEHGLMLERFCLLLTSAVAVQASVQVLLPRVLWAPVEALAERIGYELYDSDPEHPDDGSVFIIATPRVASSPQEDVR